MGHTNTQQPQLSGDQRKGLVQLLRSRFEERIMALDPETSGYRRRTVATLAKEFRVKSLVKKIQAVRIARDTLEAKLTDLGFSTRYDGSNLTVIGGKAEERYKAEAARYEAFIEALRFNAEELSRRLWLASTREEAERILAEADRYTTQEPNTETKMR